MIHFLIELLVRRTWFGQFSELYFILNWLVMRCKLRPILVADTQQTAWSKMWAKVKSGQCTLVISHRVIQLTTMSFWVPETRLHLPQVNKLKKSLWSEWSTLWHRHPFLFLFLPHPQKSSALSQSEATFVELGECSQNMLSEAFWTPNIASSQFDEYSELYLRSKSLPN